MQPPWVVVVVEVGVSQSWVTFSLGLLPFPWPATEVMPTTGQLSSVRGLPNCPALGWKRKVAFLPEPGKEERESNQYSFPVPEAPSPPPSALPRAKKG